MKFSFYLILKITLLIFLLVSLYPWFFWGLDELIVLTILNVSFLVSFLFNLRKFQFTGNSFLITITFIFLIFYNSFGSNLFGYLGELLRFLPFMFLSGMRKEFSTDILSFITKSFAFILFPSILWYLVSFFLQLPNLGVLYHPSSDLYIFDNYFLFVKFIGLNSRFSSIFLEPGYLGTCCSFLLYANGFYFKLNRVKIIFVALILTFSLAGFTVFLLGYLYFKVFIESAVSRKVLSIVYVFLGFLFLYIFSIYINDGNNIINKYIFERIRFDEQKVVSGNNRFSLGAENAFDYAISYNYFWTGLPKDQLDSEFLGDTIKGAGYIIFILKYGVFSIFIYFIIYFLFVMDSMNRKYSFGFLLLIILTFLQASYPWSSSWILPYVLGIYSFDKISIVKTL